MTLRDVMTVVQRLEMVRRISLEIDSDVVEFGTDGRQLKLQLEELVGDNDTARELIVRDYHANPDPPTAAQVSATLEELDWLSDNELLDFTTLARVFGYPSTLEAQDSAMSSRGYRAMAGIPRLQFAHVDLLVRSFGSLAGTAGRDVRRPAVSGGHRLDVGPPHQGGPVSVGRVDDRRSVGLTLLCCGARTVQFGAEQAPTPGSWLLRLGYA